MEPAVQNMDNEQVYRQQRFNLLELTRPARICVEVMFFLLMTIVVLIDVITDVWVLAVYAQKQHMIFMGVALFLLCLQALTVAFMHAIQMRHYGSRTMMTSAACFVFNFPLLLGVIGDRLRHFGEKSQKACADIATYRPKKEWIFVKLVLVHALLGSAPQLTINTLHMLVMKPVSNVQYVSAVASMLSLVFGVVFYEKARKERNKAKVDLLQMLIIFLYNLLILIGRVLAVANFVFYFGAWLTAIFLPHFILVFVISSYVYRKVWRVSFVRISLHSIYCLWGYFPVHNEYRPDGEIILFFVVFMIENILMVALPYSRPAVREINPAYAPGTSFSLTVTLLSLVGSAVGLILMFIYYFCIHRSSSAIRDGHVSWVGRLFQKARKEEEMSVRDPRPKLYITREEREGATGDNRRYHEQEYLTAPDTTGPPGYEPPTPKKAADGQSLGRTSYYAYDDENDQKSPFNDPSSREEDSDFEPYGNRSMQRADV